MVTNFIFDGVTLQTSHNSEEIKYVILCFMLTTDRASRNCPSRFFFNVFSAIQIDFLLDKYLNEENTFALPK